MKPSRPLLSVVVPMFNGGEYIVGCINSVLNQELSNNDYEIIVIDDGSTDDGASIVKVLMNEHDNISLVQQEKQGLGLSRNIGVAAAKGEWIHFVDCDDLIPPNGYQTVIAQLKECNNENVSPNILSFKSQLYAGGKVKNPCEHSNQIQFDGTFWDYVNKFGFRVPVWGYWIRKDFWLEKDLSFTKVSYAEDVEFNVKLFHNYDSRICVIDTVAYDYIVHQDSITTNQSPTRLECAIKDIADIYKYVIEIKKSSKYDSSRFVKPINLLSQHALTRLLLAPFPTKIRKELIAYCYERELFPLKHLVNSKVESIGNFLIKNPKLMALASPAYRKVFIPLIKPHIDLNSGQFVLWNNKSPLSN